jgi:hypothetical protein
MKNVFISLLLLLSVQSFAQVSVEDIKTDNDMNKFLEKYYFKGNRNDTVVRYGIVTNYYDSSFNMSFDPGFIAYLTSLKSARWIKADFNKDGRLDLLLPVSLNESSRVLAFLSQKDSSYCVKKLSNSNNEYGEYFVKYNDSNKNIIVGVADPDINDNGEVTIDSSARIRIDTLVYKDGFFADYDMSEKPLYKIDTFRISYFGSLPGTNGTAQMIIPRVGNIQYAHLVTDNSGNDTMQLFEMNWEKPAKDSFFSLIERLNLANYKDKYDPLWKVSYGSITKTEIVFDNNKTKEITDHGEVVPAGLLRAYDIINKLKQDDKWKYIRLYSTPIVGD